MIKAIETRYKGYRFRSRLEARWAVLFDALEIDWEYEPEGYELGKLGRYLPDFHINTTDNSFYAFLGGILVEIKATPPTARELAKAQALAVDGKVTIIVHGTFDNPDKIEMVFCIGHGTFDAREKPTVDWPFFMRADPSVSYLDKLCEFFRSLQSQHAGWDFDLHEAAINAAKSARFEFGETPC